MSYLPQVVGARHIRGFVVSTRFDDGTEKYIDVSQWFKGPVFEPLKDPKLFKKFFIEGGTVPGRMGAISLLKLCMPRVSQERRGITKGWSEREKHVAHPKRSAAKATREFFVQLN